MAITPLTPPPFTTISFLSQILDCSKYPCQRATIHFTGCYAVNGFAYSAADCKFREFYNALHQTREDIAGIKAPIARQQIANVAEKLMDAPGRLDSIRFSPYTPCAGKPISVDDFDIRNT